MGSAVVPRKRGGLDAWVWEHHQDRLFLAICVVGSVINLTAVGIPSVVAGSLFLGMSRVEGLLWLIGIAVGALVGVFVAAVICREQIEPIRRWSAGERSDPTAMLAALQRLPQVVGIRMALVYVGLMVAISYPFVLWLARPGLSGALGLLIAYGVVATLGAILSATLAQLLAGAAAVDLGAAAGSPIPPHARWWTFRVRLVITIATLCAFAGLVTTAVVLGTGAEEQDYLAAIVVGSVWGAYIGSLVSSIMVGPLLKPLGEVIDGTARVRLGDLSKAVPVLAADEFGDLAVAFNDMQQGLRERESLHAAFGSYVDPALAQRLVESGSSMFEGEEVEVTVMFADVRSFTSYSEGVTPADAVQLLNRLFDVMVPVLHEHGGHANHYLGDGLLAVFGAPQPLGGHADAAVAAAIEIQQRVRANLGDELRIGIGVNSGPVIAGTVGGGGRLEFTVIGDTVNAAARVEALTKETGDAILITEATRLALSPPRRRSTKRGDFEVRGKAARLTLHAINPFPRTGPDSEGDRR